jgi:hypothetical protein
MNRNESQPAMVLSRPLTERLAEDLNEVVRLARTALATLFRRPAVPGERRMYDSVAHLNEHVLKDIGAPHWLVARAAAQREAQHLQWIDMDFR